MAVEIWGWLNFRKGWWGERPRVPLKLKARAAHEDVRPTKLSQIRAAHILFWTQPLEVWLGLLVG